MKLTKTCTRFLRKHGGTILAVAASVGVVATAIETGRATTKAKHLLAVDEALRTYNEDEQGIVEEPPTKKQIVLICWKAYVPAVILGGGTIACILSSNALNKKQIASLTAGYMALGYLHATEIELTDAFYNANRYFALNGELSMNDFTSYLPGLDFTPEGDTLGWCAEYLTNEWEYYWIDFNYYKQTTDDGLEVYYVEAFQEPIKEFLDYDVMKRHLDYKGV